MNPQHREERPRAPPTADLTMSMLKPDERRLIEMARRVGFGCLTNIRVSDGEPRLAPRLTVRRKYRLGRPDRGRCLRLVHDDYKLKDQHRDFITHLRAIKEGVIVSIEIEDGLPVNLVVQEELPFEAR
ncbi:MAG: hypothetical protein L6R00_20825 [Phycisphaerae bacterium]|nr:hypothetical protein [Phycisphaerae bacterium]